MGKVFINVVHREVSETTKKGPAAAPQAPLSTFPPSVSAPPTASVKQRANISSAEASQGQLQPLDLTTPAFLRSCCTLELGPSTQMPSEGVCAGVNLGFIHSSAGRGLLICDADAANSREEPRPPNIFREPRRLTPHGHPLDSHMAERC